MKHVFFLITCFVLGIVISVVPCAGGFFSYDTLHRVFPDQLIVGLWAILWLFLWFLACRMVHRGMYRAAEKPYSPAPPNDPPQSPPTSV